MAAHTSVTSDVSPKLPLPQEGSVTKDNLVIAHHLLPLLDVARFNVEPVWLSVGRALYSITEGGTVGLDLWVQHSAKATASGRDKAACTAIYPTLCGSQVTVKTIAWFARADAPSEYQKWHSAWCKESLTAALSCPTETGVEAVYRVFWLDYMCTSLTAKDSWYHFAGHYLKQMDDAIYLRTDIANKFVQVAKDMRSELCAKSMVSDQATCEMLEAHIAQIGTFIKELDVQAYRSNLITACQEKFYVEGFDKVHDTNVALTGWTNGVSHVKFWW